MVPVFGVFFCMVLWVYSVFERAIRAAFAQDIYFCPCAGVFCAASCFLNRVRKIRRESGPQ